MADVVINEEYAVSLNKFLYECMVKKEHCEFMIQEDDDDDSSKSIYANAGVLAFKSKLFNNSEGLDVSLIMKYTQSVLDAVLKYCYTGEISVIDSEREQFIEFAKDIGIDTTHMYSKEDLTNCWDILKNSTDSNLKKKAMNLIIEKFWAVYKTSDFLSLPASTVIEIISSDDLVTLSEEYVFKAVRLWVKTDFETRKIHLPDLFKCLRLSAVSLENLSDTVLQYYSEYPDLVQVIGEAIESLSSNKSNKTDKSRKKSSKLIVVSSDESKGKDTIEIYDDEKNAWTQSKDCQFERSQFATVLLDDRMLIIGGSKDSNSGEKTVDYIDFKDGQKYTLNPLKNSRYEHAAVVLELESSTDVYAIGGRVEKTKFLSSVEKWNSNTLEWEVEKNPLLTPVAKHSAIVVNGKIFVTGGVTYKDNKEMIVDDLQMYSPEYELVEWTNFKEMPRKRHSHSSAQISGKIIVVGGRGEGNDIITAVDSYHIGLNKWTTYCDLPSPQTSSSIYMFGDKFLAIGGNLEPLETYTEYSATDKTYKKVLANLNTQRSSPLIMHVPYTAMLFN
ncbi:kelch-like protein 25 [Arctopsyche grandis]|uniref:kelch-like protein 25 n=1 Tax=Arctopsyche grandis TaxID=121162 RepID=UPI00406D9230